MAKRAQAGGLDGILITEHGEIWQTEEHAKLQAAFPDLVILRGVEVRYGTLDHTVFYQGMEAKELFEKA